MLFTQIPIWLSSYLFILSTKEFEYMKYLFLLFIFVSITAKSEVFTHKFSKGPARKIKIEKLSGFHVNSKCIENKNECLALISKPKKGETQNLSGNPASDFCSANNGKSEILRDSKNNEYDFCVLNDKYFVDSWDFYSLNKK